MSPVVSWQLPSQSTQSEAGHQCLLIPVALLRTKVRSAEVWLLEWQTMCDSTILASIGQSMVENVAESKYVHWPNYNPGPHCRCSTCKGFLCCNEKKCFRAYHAQWVGVKYATEHGRWELCLLAKVQSRPHSLAQHVSSLSAAKEGNGSRAYTMQSKRLKGCKYIVLVSTTK